MYATLCEVCVPAHGSDTLSAHRSVREGSRVTSACSGGFLKPVRSATERFQVPAQLPVHLPGRKSAADSGLVKALICAAARCGQVGLMASEHCL